MSSTLLGILITFIIVLVLVVILIVAMKLEEWRRKVAFKEKLGSGSSSNLPLKAINRVMENIQRMKKTREKEWISEERKFKKALKNLETRKTKNLNI